jgi:nicotinate phosphoribosyltransferase
MSVFDQKRLTQDTIRLDINGLRRGYYTDKYFTNVMRVLSGLNSENYTYSGGNPRNVSDAHTLDVGNAFVEAQIFNRRSPIAMIAGIDVSLNMLRYCTGYYDAGVDFIETWQDLEVDAVHDGDVTYYDGDPEDVLTVIEVRGRYRDFAMLETPILGVLSRASRIATNVYEVLQVSNGKSVLYFPARFDLPETQALDGYAYYLAIRRYNMEYKQDLQPLVSTDAQGAWWGGRGVGTVPHALIAAFVADTVETMLQFARHVPIETPRIMLADFDNDVLAAARETLANFWPHYREAYEAGDDNDMKRWSLNGVRADTSGQIRDQSLDEDDPKGVSPLLIRKLRAALNSAWESWNVPASLEDVAKNFCKQVQIIVSGGFNREKVELFERSRAPVDSYAVGSSFLSNDKTTNTDFTMDVVRVRINGQWVDMAKVGRRPSDNPNLQRVDLSEF